MSYSSILSVLFAVLAACASLVSAQRFGWKDSYSINGKCYCETTFDHNIGGIIVDTNAGRMTVREACKKAGSGPEGNRIYYNDVQCGNGPANDAGDEDWCPGRVDLGDGNRSGCMTRGPKWDLSGSRPAKVKIPSRPLFVEESGGGSVNVLTGFSVTNPVTGASSPLGRSIKLSSYPQGFGIRAEVNDGAIGANPIKSVKFTSSSGLSKTEFSRSYDMFGASGSWPNPPKGTVVLTAVATVQSGATQTIRANINLK